MSEWKTVCVADVANPRGLVGGPFGSSLGSKDYVPSGIPVIRGVNLASDAKFNAREFVYVTREKVEHELYRNLAEPGDVVFTQRGTLGQVGIVPDSPYSQYVISQSQMRLRVDPARTIADFMYYQFKSPAMLSAIRNHAITTGVPHINLSILGNLRFSLPPLATQEAISAVFSALDAKIAINEQISYASLALAQVEYEDYAEKESWPKRPMGRAAQWLSGGTPSTTEPSYWHGDIPWISALSLKSPWIMDSDRKVTQLGAENGTRIVPKDVVVFVVRGSSLDSEFRIGLTQREVAFGQDCKALVAAEGTDPVVLFLAIRSRNSDILNLVDHAGHGAGRLATDLIANLLIAVPQTLNSGVCNRLRNLVDIGARRQVENQVLVSMRNILLPKLMSGEIRVRDAERIVEGAT
jgi:type I restriction enzyme S subunit